jgi:hypothetical protein
MDGLLALFSRQRPVLCRRCGWRSREAWSDSELTALQSASVIEQVDTDPNLRSLDADTKRQKRRKKASRSRSRIVDSRSEFGLADLAIDTVPSGDDTAFATDFGAIAGTPPTGRRVRRRKRRNRQRIFAFICVVALAGFVATMVLAADGCSPAANLPDF